MSVFEPALVAHLQADPQLNGLINGRLRPGRLSSPETLPAVVYQRISTVRRSTFDGSLLMAETRFQFDVWAERQADVAPVSFALTRALHGYNGYMGDFYVQIPRQSNEFDSYETDTGLYRRMCEFIVWHSEGNE